MEFTGKRVLVTGAGKGIGRETAMYLALRGAHVVALSRTQADLGALSEATGCRGITVDLAEPAAARAAAREAGACDFLVNCAGINILEPFVDMSDEAYDAILGTNLRAALIVTQEFARMRIAAGGGGAIVNVSSIAAHCGFVDHTHYAASKAGLEGATRAMARELGPYGIRVNAIAPTVTMTDLAARAWSAPAKAGPMLARTPMGRFAEPREVAEAIALLLDDRATLITGAVLPVDGGFLAS